MIRYIAPHDPVDQAKLAILTTAYRTGQPVTPVVVGGDVAFTGSHRLAAYWAAFEEWAQDEDGDLLEPELETIEVSDEDYRAACDLLDISWHVDATDAVEFAEALYNVTGDEDLKAALKDQF